MHLLQKPEPEGAGKDRGACVQQEVEEPSRGAKRLVRGKGFRLQRGEPGDREAVPALHIKKADRNPERQEGR